MKTRSILSKLIIGLIILGGVSCSESDTPTTASGGVSKKTTKVQTDADGWTVEQKNIDSRLKVDNKPGAIKHLYVISPYSGQVIIYSTVKGKVTSSGKRLTPNTVGVNPASDLSSRFDGIDVTIGNEAKVTSEVLQDDGTYGSSCEYIYWFDSRGIYHQHFFTGGQIIHVADQPLNVGSVTINMEK